ncbi:hypothetical protein BGW36DRAFT_424669 [Talaromyces proteolyticus]|uniref:Uncharacterized protein n=1 Tax=Talaromyces proteolyticus TaxID=1131652 RepID=A0AAD4KZG1_9EURO|nr:uncharacterized protein BGW36DRAFT_424669 [Talaromyces proteolyticus]KAH8702392.1 hypothetical protein BGW36DRAFT_424669 [Talaromyces proteolyticus]
MATATPTPTHPPEIHNGTTTSWFPLTTAFPSSVGCESSFWMETPPTIAAWDPGYGLYVQPGLECQPPEVTTWWDENKTPNINTTATKYSIGPIVCPSAYTTAKTSVNQRGSTGYSFFEFLDGGVGDECMSPLSASQVIAYATQDSSWITTSSTIHAASFVVGVQVNGWLFPTETATTTQPSQPTQHAQTAQTTAQSTQTAAISDLSHGAIAGISVGVAAAAIMIAAGAGVFFLRRRKNRQYTVDDGLNGENPQKNEVDSVALHEVPSDLGIRELHENGTHELPIETYTR